jgi:hypothetical protein
MSKPKKIVLLLLLSVVAFVGLVVGDWWRFATSGAIDPKRGLYGNPHLEVWIDINARMPEPMRLWACKTLREREKAQLGGNGLPPHSCQPDFGAYAKPASFADATIEAIARSAAGSLLRGAGTPPAELVACVTQALGQTLTPERRATLNEPAKGDPNLLMELNRSAADAAKTCQAKAAAQTTTAPGAKTSP